VPEALAEWRLATVSQIEVHAEEAGTRAAAAADLVNPQRPADGVYRFASGRYRVTE
jgi:hypothetical protein